MSAFKSFKITSQIDSELGAASAINYDNGDLMIAIMPSGWVFVGFITRLEDKEIRLDCCHNIHKWGTTKGLGQLAVEGPQPETILNPVGTMFGTPLFLMKADLDKW